MSKQKKKKNDKCIYNNKKHNQANQTNRKFVVINLILLVCKRRLEFKHQRTSIATHLSMESQFHLAFDSVISILEYPN